MSLLDTIRKAVDKGVKQAKLYRNATLTKYTPGAHTPGNISGGTNPVPTSYPCRGTVSGYDAHEIALAGSLIQSDDRKITLIGGSLPPGIAPVKEDTVTIQDVDGVTRTFRIVESPDFDEAGAVFTCQGRA